MSKEPNGGPPRREEGGPPPPVTYDTHATGYALFRGDLKLAVVTTRHNLGLARDGRVVYEPMPRSSWTIHFTSPCMSVDDLAAVAASLPTEA